jgi:hypothetical protein
MIEAQTLVLRRTRGMPHLHNDVCCFGQALRLEEVAPNMLNTWNGRRPLNDVGQVKIDGFYGGKPGDNGRKKTAEAAPDVHQHIHPLEAVITLPGQERASS